MELPEISDYELEDELWRRTAATGEGSSLVYTVQEVIVVLGRGSRPEVELELEVCLEEGVKVQRRRGGGCSVVLDPGNLIIAASLPVEGLGRNPEHFERLNAWVIDGLERVGVPGVYQDGASDLVYQDRKVGGTCIYRTRGVLHYAASLLIEPRLELIERYLKHPPREPEYRRGRSHGEFLQALAAVPGAPAPEAIRQNLTSELSTLWL